mgnify:CR=1 FL=1
MLSLLGAGVFYASVRSYLHSEGFRRLLDSHCTLLATVEDGKALLEAVEAHRPDIVILDISMPVMNGIDAGRALSARYPDLKLVYVTMHADPAYIKAAFQAGASAYILKRSLGEELTQARHRVTVHDIDPPRLDIAARWCP